MSNNTNKISLPVIKRLPRYYRYVSILHQMGVATVSSSELASYLGTTASQVRQDFNCFGGFGQQGVGYSVAGLAHELEELLFSGDKLDTVLIGTGRLGRTISGFLASEAQGFRLVAAFDSADTQIGQTLGDLSILDVATLEDFCQKNQPQVAVLCVPDEGAEALAPRLFRLGLGGIWNFSHYDFASRCAGIQVENVHLGDSLSSLGYRVRHPLPEKETKPARPKILNKPK